MGKMYRRVKELTWKKDKSQKNKSIINKQGTLLNDPEAVKERWKEYIEELYNKAEKPAEIEIESQNEVVEDLRGPERLDSELMQAIKDMKSGKAEGEDGIPAEILKALDPEMIRYLLHLCKSIYTEGAWPQDFLPSIVVPLQKKPNAQRCEDHRTISLISRAVYRIESYRWLSIDHINIVSYSYDNIFRYDKLRYEAVDSLISLRKNDDLCHV